ncbi:Fic family protein [Dactylosporangium roseum]|uniref:Fic family protein n=1 Tax=Dactylosporangium roseum TaxID=47989 RepID=A0ABY5Z773_9ACTN|nr:Fic family protein [Dactylosporangium roseum]UWZ37886.1 Fic family protein [Dactylosporangium roseum]
MSIVTAQVVRYCAEECSWQQSGEVSVADMVDAWRYAHRHRFKPITVRDVLALGRLVEPRKNRGGFRKAGVRVGWDVKMHHDLVPAALDDLLERQPVSSEAEATEWFRQYEEIHPFRDGNGRTGTLLYNWLRDTLPRPVHVPNLWEDPRREVAALQAQEPR